MNKKIGLYIADLRPFLTGNSKRSDATNCAKELFLPQILIKEFNLKSEEYKIECNNHGKPIIVNHKSNDFHFNISHSGNIWVCAVATFNIGIDIEKIKNGKQSIVDYYFTKEEQESLAQSNNFNRHFFEIWTAKEAYAKFFGTGLSASLMREYCVKEGIICNNNSTKAYIHTYTLSEEYIYTIACNFEYIEVTKHLLTEIK